MHFLVTPQKLLGILMIAVGGGMVGWSIRDRQLKN